VSGQVSISPSRIPWNLPVGSGGAQARPCGTLTLETTAVGTDADTTEKTLWSYTLPANTLTTDGQALYVVVAGGAGATANTKTWRLKVNATVIGSRATAANNTGWGSEAYLIRTDSTTLTGAHLNQYGTTGITNLVPATATVDFTQAITLSVTGQNSVAAANDLVKRFAWVRCL